MPSDSNKRPGVTSDPSKPVYDNPVGNKGDLVAGNNVLIDQADGRPGQDGGREVAGEHGHRPGAPRVPDSDKRLGQKPPSDD
jgi:hypothetical protein